MVHFDGQDAGIPMETVHAFEKAQAKVRAQIYTANHGFICDQRAAFIASEAELLYKDNLDFFTINLVAS